MSARSSGFPWGPLPRRLTPKPMPSWMAPRRASQAIPAVRSSTRPPAAEEAMPPPESTPTPIEAELAPASQHEVKIAIFEEEESPEIDALRLQNAQLETALAEAIAENTRMRKEILAASEKELVKLAIAIAEQVVDGELAIDPDLPIKWAKKAIDQLATDDEITIAISPEVEPLVSREKWLEFVPNAVIVVDASLKPGHTQVRAGATRLGAGAVDRMHAALEAIGESPR